MLDGISEQQVPKSSHPGWTYSTFLLLGVTMVFPWNSLVTALDYFIVKLPCHDVDFLVSILSNGPLFVTSILTILFGYCFSDRKVILISMIAMTLLTVTLPLFPQLLNNPESSWICVSVTILILSAANGIMQLCCFGLAGATPGNYTATLNTGSGVSGVSISIVRAVSLIIFPTNGNSEDTNYFYGSLLYFGLGAISLVSSGILLKFSSVPYCDIRSKTLQEGICADSRIKSGIMVQNQDLHERMIATEEDEEECYSLQYFMRIHNSLLLTGYGNCIVFIQTMMIFPGVLLKGGIGFINSIAWQVWIITTLFNLTDTLSRATSERYMILTEKTTFVATMCRWALIIASFLSAFRIPFFHNDAVKILNICLIGLTNGYISNCQLTIGVNKAKNSDRRITSKFLCIFYVFGVLLGSIIASFGIVHLFEDS
ncbi:unnamed protein product [Moneuplotes crassus]|uniref:Equilibrative nucleoside transporter n=1 Tax=Euplotes crassus TaxID=5936 RepID=A0AAD1UII6_EUPCR|nr:unnamed protein product [Moneuplotes crassus]